VQLDPVRSHARLTVEEVEDARLVNTPLPSLAADPLGYVERVSATASALRRYQPHIRVPPERTRGLGGDGYMVVWGGVTGNSGPSTNLRMTSTAL
jgi:hypothetical protein